MLLISDGYLVKPVKFGAPKYIGDPINAVRIFNEKQVDELVICDIDASVKGTEINYSLIGEIASEAFMPVSYGGGVTGTDEARRIVNIGIEKIVVNTLLEKYPESVTAISEALGSSSTVVSIDTKRKITGGYDTYAAHGTRRMRRSPVELAQYAESLGAGEIILSSIDREGTFSGYDLKLISSVSEAVGLPVIALGGASGLADMTSALDAGASAVAAGSFFVLNGRHRAVLISYPRPNEVRELWHTPNETS